jgi:hypothetical protein
MTRALSLLLLVAALLCGCAAIPEEWRLYGGGWRTGYVVELGPASAITTDVDSDCRLDARVGAGSDQRFAVVLYSARPGLLRQRVMPVAAGSPLGKDAWVLVNVERCDAPLVAQPPPNHHHI